MAAYREKNVKQKEHPEEDLIKNIHPSWRFSACDKEAWTFTAEQFMQIILPRLKEWEARTWNEILIRSKKENHSIDTKSLNKVAQERLEALMIEAKAVISLRMSGTYRLYVRYGARFPKVA